MKNPLTPLGVVALLGFLAFMTVSATFFLVLATTDFEESGVHAELQPHEKEMIRQARLQEWKECVRIERIRNPNLGISSNMPICGPYPRTYNYGLE